MLSTEAYVTSHAGTYLACVSSHNTITKTLVTCLIDLQPGVNVINEQTFHSRALVLWLIFSMNTCLCERS